MLMTLPYRINKSGAPLRIVDLAIPRKSRPFYFRVFTLE
jgi:hypothetical protein